MRTKLQTWIVLMIPVVIIAIYLILFLQDAFACLSSIL